MATVDRPRFKCGACGQRYGWKPELAGRTMRCQCGTTIRVPTRVATPKPLMSQPAAPSRPAPAPQPREESAAVPGLDEDDGDESVETASPPPATRSRNAQSPKKAKKKVGAAAAKAGEGAGGSSDTWKWWYYVVAGTLIGALSIYDLASGGGIIRFGRGRGPVGGLILSVLCVAVGIFSRPKKNK